MSTASLGAKSVVAQVYKGNKIAVQRGPPKVAETTDRADLRVRMYALINPIGWNNLLVPGPGAVPKIEQAEAGHISSTHSKRVGRVDRTRLPKISRIVCDIEVLHLQGQRDQALKTSE